MGEGWDFFPEHNYYEMAVDYMFRKVFFFYYYYKGAPLWALAGP